MYRLFALFLLLLTPLTGFSWCSALLTVGPELYYLRRMREGGTSQEGEIDGIRIRFDRIKGHSWYVGADYLYAEGEVKGQAANGACVNSDLIDKDFEVRVGYTLQQPTITHPFITPFAGWGCFEEENIFYPPSPRLCTFTDTYNYIVVGFLSGVNFTPLISMGVCFKVKFMQNGESKVTDDPQFEDVTLMMKEEIQARLDVPLTLKPCNSWLGMGFLLSPFYEYRHFGGREGYPFNFKDTQFQIFGARFALTYDF